MIPRMQPANPIRNVSPMPLSTAETAKRCFLKTAPHGQPSAIFPASVPQQPAVARPLDPQDIHLSHGRVSVLSVPLASLVPDSIALLLPIGFGAFEVDSPLLCSLVKTNRGRKGIHPDRGTAPEVTGATRRDQEERDLSSSLRSLGSQTTTPRSSDENEHASASTAPSFCRAR